MTTAEVDSTGAWAMSVWRVWVSSWTALRTLPEVVPENHDRGVCPRLSMMRPRMWAPSLASAKCVIPSARK